MDLNGGEGGDEDGGEAVAHGEEDYELRITERGGVRAIGMGKRREPCRMFESSIGQEALDRCFTSTVR